MGVKYVRCIGSGRREGYARNIVSVRTATKEK